MDIHHVSKIFLEKNKQAYSMLYKRKKGCVITAQWKQALQQASWIMRNDRKETDLDTFIRLINITKDKCGLLLNVYQPGKDDALKLTSQVRETAIKAGCFCRCLYKKRENRTLRDSGKYC